MKFTNRTVYTLLIALCLIGFWVFENFYTPDLYSAPDGEASKTEMNEMFLPSSTTGAIVHHDHFSLSYHEKYEQAEWVAYVLRKNHLTYDDRERPYFIEDPKVKTKSADWRNYKRSGYDRGHLCPAGDRRFSEYAYNETFYTSNISPQDRDFNAGVWNRLEMQVRQWAKKYGDIQVVTGGILEKGLWTIGEEDVAIPKYYYKIVSRGNVKNPKVLAFLIPHEESTSSLKNFVVTVDELERMTKIDFFEKMPDALESKFEAGKKTNNWKF
ncbi:endonuclease G [Saonia flava]|uniref:Endonuclease n=1 Tax=Saonia flava TaxID=523696 RepID=A0A846R0E6_9FLAO|nr:DNA/RNA non-specific endonuclease [Saonia flava]NJB71903.1 endonuclease G [Saonia flava]